MSERLFTREEAWLGGSCELAIDLGPPDDARLAAARAAVWSFSGIDAPVACSTVVVREEGDRAVTSESVPNARWCGYLVADGASLRWYPPNRGAPISLGR